MSSPPRRGSHWWPRTRHGQIAVVAFVLAMALAQPPVVNWADRIEPMILGMPFLYAWLLGAYSLMIGVLLWAWRKGL